MCKCFSLELLSSKIPLGNSKKPFVNSLASIFSFKKRKSAKGMCCYDCKRCLLSDNSTVFSLSNNQILLNINHEKFCARKNEVNQSKSSTGKTDEKNQPRKKRKLNEDVHYGNKTKKNHSILFGGTGTTKCYPDLLLE